jgi:hypothetical protein
MTCNYYGKVFESKHPLKAEYCSAGCRHKATYTNLKRRKQKGKA